MCCAYRLPHCQSVPNLESIGVDACAADNVFNIFCVSRFFSTIMAKFIILIISMCIFDAARTFPVIADNHEIRDFSDIDVETKYQNEFRKSPSQDGDIASVYIGNGVPPRQPVRSSRRKRSIINSGVCPAGQVWKPRPFNCITCEKYEELTGNDC